MYSMKPPGFRCTICRQVYSTEEAAERCQRSGDPGVRLDEPVVSKGDVSRRGVVVGFADGHRKVRVRFPDDDGKHHQEEFFLAAEVQKPPKLVPGPRGILGLLRSSKRPPE